jgi:hypothetical protein
MENGASDPINTMVFHRVCHLVGLCGPGAEQGGHAGRRRLHGGAGNTPQRQAALKALPPHKFVHQVRNNVVMFTYADPTICDCLYVGNQAAYDRYRQNVFVKNIADEQQMTAQMNQMDWGPWGPGWYN